MNSIEVKRQEVSPLKRKMTVVYFLAAGWMMIEILSGSVEVEVVEEVGVSVFGFVVLRWVLERRHHLRKKRNLLVTFPPAKMLRWCSVALRR